MSGVVQPKTTTLTATNFDDFLANVMHTAHIHPHITLDLRSLQFIDVFAMVSIIYCCADVQERFGCRVRLEFTEEGAGSFLPRVGFFDVLGSEVICADVFTPARLEWERALHGEDRALLELTRIDSPTAVDMVMDKLIHVLRYHLRYQRHDAYDLAIVFSELCNNVLDHSPVTAQGLAAMQVFGSSTGRFMQFVVGDRGVGIKATLQRNPRFAALRSDIQAIMASTHLGVSEHVEATRGNGLHHLLELAFKHHGSIQIRSGQGKVYWRMDHQQRYQFPVPHLQGAQFSITFPTRMGKHT